MIIMHARPRQTDGRTDRWTNITAEIILKWTNFISHVTTILVELRSKFPSDLHEPLRDYGLLLWEVRSSVADDPTENAAWRWRGPPWFPHLGLCKLSFARL